MDQTEKTSSFRHGGTGRCKKKQLKSSWDWHWLLTTTAYCICNGPNDGSFMISCHFCDEWFHRNCVGVTEKHARTENRPVCLSWKQKKRVCCVKTKGGRENEVGVQRQKSFKKTKNNFLLQTGVRRVGVATILPRPGALPGGEERRPASDWFVCALFQFQCVLGWCYHMNCMNTIRDHLPQSFFFGTPTQISTAMAILANAMVGLGGVRGYTISCVRSTSSRHIISFIRRRTTSLDQWPGTGGMSVWSISPCTPSTPFS